MFIKEENKKKLCWHPADVKADRGRDIVLFGLPLSDLDFSPGARHVAFLWHAVLDQFIGYDLGKFAK